MYIMSEFKELGWKFYINLQRLHWNYSVIPSGIRLRFLESYTHILENKLEKEFCTTR